MRIQPSPDFIDSRLLQIDKKYKKYDFNLTYERDRYSSYSYSDEELLKNWEPSKLIDDIVDRKEQIIMVRSFERIACFLLNHLYIEPYKINNLSLDKCIFEISKSIIKSIKSEIPDGSDYVMYVEIIARKFSEKFDEQLATKTLEEDLIKEFSSLVHDCYIYQYFQKQSQTI